MKILVIGAAGRLGTTLVEQLEEKGEHTLRLRLGAERHEQTADYKDNTDYARTHHVCKLFQLLHLTSSLPIQG